MKNALVLKVVLIVALLAGAGYLTTRQLTKDDGVTEETYFYDLSEQKLVAMPLETLPPARGINDEQEDAVRAVVISTSSNPRDKAGQRIAYLEKYAPELKTHLAEVRAGRAEPLSSKVRNGYRFVKRLSDTDWHSVASPEGTKILNEWNVPGPDGKTPAVCVP